MTLPTPSKAVIRELQKRAGYVPQSTLSRQQRRQEQDARAAAMNPAWSDRNPAQPFGAGLGNSVRA